MKHRVYVPDLVQAGEELELSGEEFHHAVKVVRARAGEEVELFDGKGHTAAATVRSVGSESARLVITDRFLPSRESEFQLTMACALIAPEKFELVLQKGCELGVPVFLPLLTDRTDKGHMRLASKRTRWEKIILEAVKQSGRSALPELREPMTFDEAIRSSGIHLVFDADTQGPPLSEGAKALVAPEGGWSEREIGLAKKSGAFFRRLGPRRLRAETAAIAAITVLGMELGDLAGA